MPGAGHHYIPTRMLQVALAINENKLGIGQDAIKARRRFIKR
jgi:hypothetical protein